MKDTVVNVMSGVKSMLVENIQVFSICCKDTMT